MNQLVCSKGHVMPKQFKNQQETIKLFSLNIGRGLYHKESELLGSWIKCENENASEV